MVGANFANFAKFWEDHRGKLAELANFAPRVNFEWPSATLSGCARPAGKELAIQRRRRRSKIKLNPVPVQDFPDRSDMARKETAHLLGIIPAGFRLPADGGPDTPGLPRPRPVVGAGGFCLQGWTHSAGPAPVPPLPDR